MLLFIVIVMVVLLILSLLITPIIIYIDTLTNQYYIQLLGMAKANFEKDDAEFFRIRLNILFFNLYIYPLKKKASNKEKEIKNHHSLKSKKRISIRKIYNILKTFKIKQFFINMDTGNYILNAKLYPLFTLLNYNTGNFHINFQGRNQLVLLAKNRPIDIIRSFINL